MEIGNREETCQHTIHPTLPIPFFLSCSPVFSDLVVQWLALLADTLLTRAEGAKVLSGLWDGLTEQTESDTTGWLTIDLNVEENLNTREEGDGGWCGERRVECWCRGRWIELVRIQ